MIVPRVCSLDIETYGMCERDHAGRPLPTQQHFHPQRSLHQDRVPLESLVLTCAVTFPREDPRWPLTSAAPTATSLPTSPSATPALPTPTSNTSRGWNLQNLMQLQPGPTMLLELWRPEHVALLARILLYVDTILGVNLLFDIPYLRRFHNLFYSILNGRHTILDFIYFRYLLSELTTARSLKDYGPLHGIYTYSEEQLRLKQGRRYPSPLDPEFREYQCSDPHNSVLACAHAAHSIFFEYSGGNPEPSQWNSSSPLSPSSSSSVGSPPATNGETRTAKLSPECIDHYSSLWWTCIRLAESGIPGSLALLSILEADLLTKAKTARDHCNNYGLQLSGKGSQDSQITFINAALEAADTDLARTYAFGDDRVPLLNSKLIELTEAEQRPSVGVSNRAVISVLLRAVAPDTPAPTPAPSPQLALFAPEPPPPTTTLALLDRWNDATRAEKLVSTYTYPLLRHHRSDPADSINALIPLTPTRLSAFPPLRPEPPPDLAPDIGLGFPTIYAVPSNVKDNSGTTGGQKQSRLSIKNPAAPTWPPQIKACIRSRYARGTVWVFDLSQIELKVAGILSGEPSILNNYVTGGDLHTERCIDLFGEEDLALRYGPAWRKNPTFKENERQWAKKFNFEDLYLAGADKMQRIFIEETNKFLPISFFVKVVASRRRLRPILLRWQQSVLDHCERYGYYELPFYGQSRYFIGGVSCNPIGEMVNFPIQATAANVMHAIMRRIHELLPPISHPLPRIHPFLNVYDAGLIDSHPSVSRTVPALVEQAVDYVRNSGYWLAIQRHYGNTCPLTYEIKELKP